MGRFKNRHRGIVTKYSNKFSEEQEVLQWFFTVYNSKYCSETWETLTYDWSYEQFLEFENMISIQFDIEQASERDSKIEEERNRPQR